MSEDLNKMIYAVYPLQDFMLNFELLIKSDSFGLVVQITGLDVACLQITQQLFTHASTAADTAAVVDASLPGLWQQQANL